MDAGAVDACGGERSGGRRQDGGRMGREFGEHCRRTEEEDAGIPAIGAGGEIGGSGGGIRLFLEGGNAGDGPGERRAGLDVAEACIRPAGRDAECGDVAVCCDGSGGADCSQEDVRAADKVV